MIEREPGPALHGPYKAEWPEAMRMMCALSAAGWIVVGLLAWALL